MKNKNLNTIIVVCLVLIVVLSIYIYLKKQSVSFSLKGDETIVLKYGQEYIEPGYIARDGFGSNLSKNVNITSTVNSKEPGVYQITYTLDYKGKSDILRRQVIVNSMMEEDIEFILNGDSEISFLVNSQYQEYGAYVLNKVNYQEITDNITINSNVNNKKEGTYEVNYTYQANGITLTKTRKVTVFDIKYSLNPSKKTSDKVEIIFDLDNVSNYVKTALPNGEIETSNSIKYQVNSNGDYKFTIYTAKGEYEKNVNVNNIIAKYTCVGEINRTGTRIEVTSSGNDNIKEYEWVTPKETIKGTNVLTKEKIISKASVNLVFSDNDKYSVSCDIKDNLIYHFKYDENNTKPFMKCSTYSSQDKIILDEKLKKAVSEAGYGTRAGVVEAMRFLTGALDYKVPYEGASRYDRVGLNIGQKNAWGCSGVGLDCFYSIYWALSQNGLPLGALYAGVKDKTADEINRIKVGDYLYTPCSGNCKNIYKINHIGMVIGIDDNYLYIAEATTGNINALIVSKMDKKNPPKSGGFSLVKHIDYPSEGNVTNMWMSE